MYISFSRAMSLNRRSRAALSSGFSCIARSMASTRVLSTRCGLIKFVIIPGSFLRMRPQREALISCCVWLRSVELAIFWQHVLELRASRGRVVQGGEGLDMMSYRGDEVRRGNTPECLVPCPFMHRGGGQGQTRRQRVANNGDRDVPWLIGHRKFTARCGSVQ
jgi:hypothetical protein